MISLFLVTITVDREEKINSVLCQGPNGSEGTVLSGSNTPHGTPAKPLQMLADALNAIEDFVISDSLKEKNFKIDGPPAKWEETKVGLRIEITKYLVMAREIEKPRHRPNKRKR